MAFLLCVSAHVSVAGRLTHKLYHNKSKSAAFHGTSSRGFQVSSVTGTSAGNLGPGSGMGLSLHDQPGGTTVLFWWGKLPHSVYMDGWSLGQSLVLHS